MKIKFYSKSMISTKLKLYKILRQVGLQKKRILDANHKEDLYLDELDCKLLTFYFEKEFKIDVKDDSIPNLTTLHQVEQYIENNTTLYR